MRTRVVLTVVATGVGGLFLLAAPAGAHVGLSPKSVPIGDPATVTFSVPNECEGGDTTQVSVQLPEGASEVSPASGDGWNASAEPASPPVVTWTGGAISGENRQTFSLTARFTGEVGDLLFFPAVQTCSTGDPIRWVDMPSGEGAPEPERPAPSVQLVAGSGALPTVAPTVASTAATTSSITVASTTAAPTTVSSPATDAVSGADDDGASAGSVVAVVLIVIAIFGGAVLMGRRRMNGRGAEGSEAGAPEDGSEEGSDPK